MSDINIINELISNYGATGGVIIVMYFLLRSNNQKLDRLLQLTNKAYGLTLSLVDKAVRERENKGDD